MNVFKKFWTSLKASFGGLSKNDGDSKFEIDEKEAAFMISLYPNGRTYRRSLEQLNEKYSASESVIQNRMNRYISKMERLGLLKKIRPEGSDEVITLTRVGVARVRDEIRRLYENDIDKFAVIINDLMNNKDRVDKWAISFFRAKSREMLRRYQAFHIVIYEPRTFRNAIEELINVFDYEFSKKRFEQIQYDVEKMDALGLVRLDKANGEVYLQSTPFAKSLLGDILENGEVKTKGSRSYGSAGLFKKILTVNHYLVIVAVIVTCFAMGAIVFNTFSFDFTQEGLAEPLLVDPISVYMLIFVPILTLICYFVFEKIYYTVMAKL